jgi:hypothetical protein
MRFKQQVPICMQGCEKILNLLLHKVTIRMKQKESFKGCIKSLHVPSSPSYARSMTHPRVSHCRLIL